MRHIISILLQNEAGALARVANMFSSRGYNIESLNVAPTNDASMSRLTMVATGTDGVISQILKQLYKLVDVVEISEMTMGEHIERELLLIKVRAEDQAIHALCAKNDAVIVDDEDHQLTIQFTGTFQAVDELIEALGNHAEILEVVRSGTVGIAKGQTILCLDA